MFNFYHHTWWKYEQRYIIAFQSKRLFYFFSTSDWNNPINWYTEPSRRYKYADIAAFYPLHRYPCMYNIRESVRGAGSFKSHCIPITQTHAAGASRLVNIVCGLRSTSLVRQTAHYYLAVSRYTRLSWALILRNLKPRNLNMRWLKFENLIIIIKMSGDSKIVFKIKLEERYIYTVYLLKYFF